MLNFIIDTSVFVLSEKSVDPNIEKDNLCMLRKNIAYLRKLRYNNSITISYMNKILLQLRSNNHFFNANEINSRIKELLNKNPAFQAEIGMDGVFDNWNELLFTEITPKKDKYRPGIIRKGKIGIFTNIPDRDSDPSDDYINKSTLSGGKNSYPQLPQDFFITFKKYCGYIADLNFKYYSFDNNYFILGCNYGNQKMKNITVTLNKNRTYIQSSINIVGIQNAEALCPPKLEIKNLTTACTEAINKFSKKLDFGNDINNNNIQLDLLPIAGPPETIYRYLETLHHVSGLFVKKSINIQNEKELVEMLNSYGLLCSPEDKKYAKHKCKYRQFLNKLGRKQFFNIHLKPATYNNNTLGHTLGGSKGSVRIYLDWDNSNKKFVLGWIGHHLPICSNCVNTTCPGY